MNGVRQCLVLFARSPREEARSKRLDRAQRLFELGARRIERLARTLPGVDFIVAAARDQRGTTFEERLLDTLARTRAQGYQRIVVVPTDVPGLTARDLARAFDLLARHPLVLGPSPDGGVYLLGVDGDASATLRGAAWQTASLFHDLRERTPGAAVLTESRTDIDDLEDLRRLRHDPLVGALVESALAATPSGRGIDVPSYRPTPLLPDCGRAPPRLPAAG